METETYVALEDARERLALLRRGPAEVHRAGRIAGAVAVLTSRVAREGLV